MPRWAPPENISSSEPPFPARSSLQWQDGPMAKMTVPAPSRSQLNDAILSTVRGGLHILGGMVQMAAGVTRLLAVTAIKAVEAAEAVVEATEDDEEEDQTSAS